MAFLTCECYCGCFLVLWDRAEIDDGICDECIDGFHVNEDDSFDEEVSWYE